MAAGKTKNMLVNSEPRGQMASGSWLLLGSFVVMTSLQSQGCGGAGWEDTGSSPLPQETVEALIGDLGDEVVLPQLNLLLIEAEALRVSISSLTDTLEAGSDSTEAKAIVQEGFVDLFLQWQHLEAMTLGPAASNSNSQFGMGLRDEIYSWPTVNPCRVDQETVSGEWGADDFFEARLVNAYGLDALEHLLFSSVDSVCPNQTNPIADGSWDELGEDGVALNRAHFAEAILNEIIDNVQEMVELWESGHAIDLTQSTSTVDVLNEVFHALYYIETYTKDLKLFHPMGDYECSSEFCTEDIEAQASGLAVEAICENIRGFSTLFAGGEGIGFDDLLVEMGAADLSIEISEQAASTMSSCEAVTLPLEEAIILQDAALEELSVDLSDLGHLVKSNLATELFLRLPSEAAGDND